VSQIENKEKLYIVLHSPIPNITVNYCRHGSLWDPEI